jgi:hypothetical protein
MWVSAAACAALLAFGMPDEIRAEQFRELAAKCRRLAKSITDQRTANSLLDLAAQYDEAADAEMDGNVRPFSTIVPPSEPPEQPA